MIEENVTVGTAEKKPNLQPTYGGLVFDLGSTTEIYYMYEMTTGGSISLDNILKSGLIKDCEHEKVESAYQDLVFSLLFSDSPNLIPDFLDVRTADHFLDHAPEIIGKIVGSDFWKVTWQSEDDRGFTPVFSAMTKDEYMAVRSSSPSDIIVIDGTRHPQYYRQRPDGWCDAVARE